MRILYLPAYFYPETAASSYLSENRNQAFSEAGFETITYAPTPCRGVTRDIRKQYSSKKYRKEKMFDGIRYLAVEFTVASIVWIVHFKRHRIAVGTMDYSACDKANENDSVLDVLIIVEN